MKTWVYELLWEILYEVKSNVEVQNFMWSAFEMMIMQLVMMLLAASIKNPASAAKERKVIAQLAQLSTEADMLASPGTVWAYNAPSAVVTPTPVSVNKDTPTPVVVPPAPVTSSVPAPGGDIFHPGS